jgi:hypothetical protein
MYLRHVRPVAHGNILTGLRPFHKIRNFYEYKWKSNKSYNLKKQNVILISFLRNESNLTVILFFFSFTILPTNWPLSTHLHFLHPIRTQQPLLHHFQSYSTIYLLVFIFLFPFNVNFYNHSYCFCFLTSTHGQTIFSQIFHY